jgi:hypothetical protein
LEEWWVRSSDGHVYVDKMIIPSTITFSDPPMNPADVFRYFEPDTGRLTFWFEEFNLKDVVAEAQRLIPILESLTST